MKNFFLIITAILTLLILTKCGNNVGEVVKETSYYDENEKFKREVRSYIILEDDDGDEYRELHGQWLEYGEPKNEVQGKITFSGNWDRGLKTGEHVTHVIDGDGNYYLKSRKKYAIVSGDLSKDGNNEKWRKDVKIGKHISYYYGEIDEIYIYDSINVLNTVRKETDLYFEHWDKSWGSKLLQMVNYYRDNKIDYVYNFYDDYWEYDGYVTGNHTIKGKFHEWNNGSFGIYEENNKTRQVREKRNKFDTIFVVQN